MEPELKDWQQLSDLNQVSEGLSESLRMTAKVRVMVTIQDSTSSDVMDAPHFEVDAGTTTVRAVKDEVVRHVGSVNIGVDPRAITGVHLFREQKGHMSAELDDSQVLAHYGVGDEGYDELFECVIDHPSIAIRTGLEPV
mmetsp:Transcript_10358/g.30753  ORF Transcript_10358/g.30753 Transcript_10358/m.30753 type:complete len:139 (-) Transcript_10358:226-642(-)